MLDQVLPLMSGQTYILDFWARTTSTLGNPEALTFSLGGAGSSHTFMSAQSSYEEFTYTITAGAGPALIFSAATLGADKIYVDDVSVTAVPEPTTMVAGALLLLPFGASTMRMLRRRTA